MHLKTQRPFKTPSAIIIIKKEPIPNRPNLDSPDDHKPSKMLFPGGGGGVLVAFPILIASVTSKPVVLENSDVLV
jgi:hypothetical protein